MNAFLQNFLDWQLLTGSLPALLETGLVNTLVLSLFSTLLGIIAGMMLALMAVSHMRWLGCRRVCSSRSFAVCQRRS